MAQNLNSKQLTTLTDYLSEAKRTNYQIPGSYYSDDSDVRKALSFRNPLIALVEFGSGVDAEFGRKYKDQLYAAKAQGSQAYPHWLINLSIDNAEEMAAMAAKYEADVESKRIDDLFSKTIAEMTGYEFQEYLQRIGIR